MIFLEKISRFKPLDFLLILGFLLIILGIGINFKGQFVEESKAQVISSEEKPTGVQQVNNKITIDISGAIKNPGVYQLDAGTIVNDALTMVGGLTSEANETWVNKNINKAEKLYDGQKIYIPKIGEILGESRDVLQNVSTNKVVRLNSATLEQLDTLSGVGPAIAQRIIDYRTETGGFKSVEEIKLVPGIGDKMFEKIKDEIQL